MHAVPAATPPTAQPHTFCNLMLKPSPCALDFNTALVQTSLSHSLMPSRMEPRSLPAALFDEQITHGQRATCCALHQPIVVSLASPHLEYVRLRAVVVAKVVHTQHAVRPRRLLHLCRMAHSCLFHWPRCRRSWSQT